MIWRVGSFMVLVVLDVTAFALLFDAPPLLLGAHATCSVGLALLLAGFVPSFVARPLGPVLVFAGIMAFFLPVIGAIGLLAAFGMGYSRPTAAWEQPWTSFAARSEASLQRQTVSTAVVGEVLRERSAETSARRFEAVLATRWMSAKSAVALLKLAQTDPLEELRLYAFSTLERMRRDLEKQTEDLTRALSTASPTRSGQLHLRLAECYWELGYEGLIEGGVLAHALQRADVHAAAATQERGARAAAELLRGRILLQLRAPDRARAALQRALDAGYPRIKALPYLAECAFQERALHAVSALLGELDATSRHIDAVLRPVVDMWRREQPS